jgi:2-amino-4-hydroxy-6-hydroxymethyldihydropteridine diphosphokinase
MSQKNKVFLGLGSNLGDRHQNLQTALNELADFLNILKISSIYQTPSWPDKTLGNYLNAVAEIETELTDLELIFRLQEIEHKMGRVREMEERNGPRVIDLDILFFNDIIVQRKGLMIPHKRMLKRNFVLVPLAEIAPEHKHPALDLTALELVNKLPDNHIIELWTEKKLKI